MEQYSKWIEKAIERFSVNGDMKESLDVLQEIEDVLNQWKKKAAERQDMNGLNVQLSAAIQLLNKLREEIRRGTDLEKEGKTVEKFHQSIARLIA